MSIEYLSCLLDEVYQLLCSFFGFGCYKICITFLFLFLLSFHLSFHL